MRFSQFLCDVVVMCIHTSHINTQRQSCLLSKLIALPEGSTDTVILQKIDCYITKRDYLT